MKDILIVLLAGIGIFCAAGLVELAIALVLMYMRNQVEAHNNGTWKPGKIRKLIHRITWFFRDLSIRERDYRRQWSENWEEGK